MKKTLPFEFVYQVIALVLAVIIVHLVYVTIVRPNADAILQAQAEQAAAGGEFESDRSLYVVLRDYEQESCFILGLWAMSIMGLKARNSLRERGMLQRRFVELSEGMSILPEDTPRVFPAIAGAAGLHPRPPAAPSPLGGAATLRLHAQRARRLGCGARGLRYGVGSLGQRTGNGALHRLGHSLDRLHRHRARHRRRLGPSLPSGGGRHHRRNGELGALPSTPLSWRW